MTRKHLIAAIEAVAATGSSNVIEMSAHYQRPGLVLSRLCAAHGQGVVRCRPYEGGNVLKYVLEYDATPRRTQIQEITEMLNLAEKHGEYALTCSADRIPYYRVVIATKRPGQFLVSQTADGIRIVAKNGKPSISGVFREAIENRAEWLLIENNKIQYYRNLATSLGVRLKQVRGQDVGSGKVVVRIIYPENAQP